MAVPATPGRGRIVAIILVVIFIAIGFVFFDPLGSNYPEGVDTDAREIRSVTISGDDLEVLTYDDELYVLSPENIEVLVLEDGTRQFISRDERTLWVGLDTAEELAGEFQELADAE